MKGMAKVMAEELILLRLLGMRLAVGGVEELVEELVQLQHQQLELLLVLLLVVMFKFIMLIQFLKM